MRNKSLIIIAMAGLPFAAMAQDHNGYLCTNGDLQRRVEIVYETGVSVPCEVHYYKDTEAPGEPQVLWRALSEEGYCEVQAEAFVEQLANWGWDCARSSGEMTVPAESEPAEEEPDSAEET